MLKPYGISFERLQEDVETAARLFRSLGSNFGQATQSKDTVITFAG